MSDDYVNAIRRVLAAHNISTYRFKHRRRHRAVVVEHGGETVTVTFPSTASDSRHGPRNAEADLRRALRGAGRVVE
jgi:enoyl-[acyl-carrier-protein] reductase (NADH)